MFRIKSQSNFTKSFLIMFLLIFIASRALLMLHAFSHQEDSDQNSDITNVSTADFLGNIIFAHEKSADKKAPHCLFCSASNFQNQISLAPNMALAMIFLYFIFSLRNFDRVKLSYLLFSNSSRAPPLVS